ncbi:MAG TPA: antitoxin family protein [Humisphaera sp.]|nr:antitoxin family protein [Humisphaera sp.]
MTIHAIYEEGVFKPTESVNLPEGVEVDFEPRVVGQSEAPDDQEAIYAILRERYDSGQHDLAERHNEHQP